MSKKLLIATRSKGKLPEISAELEGSGFEIVGLNSLPEFPPDYEVEEPGKTFEGNAIIKAMTIGFKTGLLTLADDAGLEVDALGGKPGVWSARYAPGSDEDRYRKLLRELENVVDDKRTARFRSVIAVFDPNSLKVRTADGAFEGIILREPRGAHGFGYDPIFLSTELNKAAAELSVEEKNKISHRGQALRKAKEILEKEFSI